MKNFKKVLLVACCCLAFAAAAGLANGFGDAQNVAWACNRPNCNGG